MRLFRTFKKEMILEEWGTLLRDLKGEGERVLTQTKELIQERQSPIPFLEIRNTSSSFFKGLAGIKRPFLIAKIEKQRGILLKTLELCLIIPFLIRLFRKPRYYTCYISASDYGKDLNVNWYLTFNLGLFQTLLFFLPISKFDPTLLDIFQKEELQAFGRLTYSCFLETLEQLLLENKRDPLKELPQKTKGFLNLY